MNKRASRFSKTFSIKNRKAAFNYHLIERLEAGIQLVGSEVKSIREGRVSVQDSYCYFQEHTLHIKGLHISPYLESNQFGHDPIRTRKLLVKKKQALKLKALTERKRLSIIPTMLYFNSRNLVKVEIAVGEPKKKYDKRMELKEREDRLEMNRARSLKGGGT